MKRCASLSLICWAMLWAWIFIAPDSLAHQADKAASEKPAAKRATLDPKKFAILISGVGGEELYSKKFAAQSQQLYDALTNKLGFDEKHVYLLTENVISNAESMTPGNFARATAEETRKAFAAVKAAATADSLVFIALIGHGSFDNQEAKFNLVGPDLAAKDYAALIAALPTRKVVFVDCSSSSGEFIKPLSSADRLIITATRSGSEQNVTIFADFFIRGLIEAAADTDKNGRTSVLEAFNYATKLTADWYKQKGRLATEHALLDDNGDGLGHEQAEGGDGAIAKTTYLDSKSLAEANADAEVFKWLEDKQQLEVDIEKLKARKSTMKIEDYEAELERLLVELAKLNRRIRTRRR
ncbi:MAG: caspase family protein [Acidobacteria bacterium]|nr:caspase family protein [Acidobacteriota bacterium]